jgi:hypothetical protein
MHFCDPEVLAARGKWVVSSDVRKTPAHAFYERLNEVLEQHHFDRNVEHLCRRYYKGPFGRPSITPGT